MSNKTTILEQYKKYLQTINTCENEQVPTNFIKFTKWLFNACYELDSRLWTVIKLDCIHRTIKLVNKRNIRLKEVSEDWSPIEVQECYDIINAITRAANEDPTSQEHMVLTGKLFNLIDKEKDPSMQLYMYMQHEKSKYGYRLYREEKENVQKLLSATSEEEIDSIMQEVKII